MAPTTRSSKKKKSPRSKQTKQPKKTVSIPIRDADSDLDISSDDSSSIDSEMEELVRQTAMKMMGRDSGASTRKTMAKASNDDTSPADSLPFVLDVNPSSKSNIRIGVDHIITGSSSSHTTSTGGTAGSSREHGKDNIVTPGPTSELVESQSDRQEEEEFISLDSVNHSKPKERQVKLKPKERAEVKVVTELDAGVDFSDTYLDFADDGPQTRDKLSAQMVLMKSSQDELLKKSIITPDFEKRHSIPPYREPTRLLNRRKKKEQESSTGQNWYDMAAVEMTSELRNDIKAMRMRSALDPKRFYKHNDMIAMPKFVQVGTVVESPADFYHSRIPKKQRKQTIVEELLADAQTRRYNKRKYLDLQEKSKRWGPRKKKSKKGKTGKK